MGLLTFLALLAAFSAFIFLILFNMNISLTILILRFKFLYLIFHICMERIVSQNVDKDETFDSMKCKIFNLKKLQKVYCSLS